MQNIKATHFLHKKILRSFFKKNENKKPKQLCLGFKKGNTKVIR